jgi:hypothetical protein
MGARTYNPALGRFMSVDPLFEAFPGQSAYSYAFNSPLSWSDPSGMAPEKEKKRDRVLYLFDLISATLLEGSLNELNARREIDFIFESNNRRDWISRLCNWFEENGERWYITGKIGGNYCNDLKYYEYQNDRLGEQLIKMFGKEMKSIDKETQKDGLERGFIIYRNKVGNLVKSITKQGDKSSIDLESLAQEITSNGGIIISFVHSHKGNGSNDLYPSIVDIREATNYPNSLNFVVNLGFVSLYGTNDIYAKDYYTKAYETFLSKNLSSISLDAVMENWTEDRNRFIRNYMLGKMIRHGKDETYWHTLGHIAFYRDNLGINIFLKIFKLP